MAEIAHPGQLGAPRAVCRAGAGHGGTPQAVELTMADIAVFRDKAPDAWRVEANDTDGDGAYAVGIFTGCEAERRAREYAAWLQWSLAHRSSVAPQPSGRRAPRAVAA